MSTSPTRAVTVKFLEDVYMDLIFSLLGTMANWILFGILGVQGYLYYVAFPKDPRLLKWIVFVLLLLETVQTMMWTQDTVEAFITTFTDPNVFNIVRTVWFSIPLLTGVIACIAQGFYCYRIWVLTRSKYAATLISMFAMGQLTAAIFVAIQTKRAKFLTRLVSQNRSLASIGIWGACSFACDIMIAGIMSYNLRRRDTGFENTHRIIARLVRLSIETGCITALLAGIILVLLYLPGHPPYYELAATIAAKTYSNSMMAFLNSRIKPVSNSPPFGAPFWNESVGRIGPVFSTVGTGGIVFRGESQTDFSATGVPINAP